jgi:pimeloyl-ACP methyl ester carboxylesterase
MPRLILMLLVIAAFTYVALCVGLFLAQRSFIYYPQPRSANNGNKTLTLKVNGATVLIATHAGTGPDAVIYFGGNAEDVSRSLPTLNDAFPDRSVYALNYRGYGGSTGKPSEAALIADALVLFERVQVDHPNIIVIGRSLGSGIAVHLASELPAERLVLITPYDSLLKIAASQFPFLPIRWLLLDKFESWRYATKVSAPTHLIAAQFDEIIPLASTESLYRHFRPELATLTVIRGVGHNSISETPEYISALNGGALGNRPP